MEIDTHRKDACENCSYVATKPEPSGKVDSLEKLLLLRLQREHDSAVTFVSDFQVPDLDKNKVLLHHTYL